MKNIDVHSHMMPEASIKELSGEILPLGKGDLFNIKVLGKSVAPMTRGFFELEARKKEIAEMGVDGQIISPTHHLFMYTADAQTAVKSAKVQNNGISAICKQEPERFFGNATLPLQDTGAALDEVDRAYSELGMKGIEIGSNIGGKNLDHESLHPVYEKASELGMPIFVHPNDFLGGDRLSKYYMGIVVGTLAETTVAVTSMIFGGIFNKFPKLKMVFCHGGGAIPYQSGRLKHAVSIRNELKGSNVDVDKSLKNNIYFDSVVFDDEALQFLIEKSGADNVLLGTDYPFNMGNWDSAKALGDHKGVDDLSKNKIFLENTMKLYKL